MTTSLDLGAGDSRETAVIRIIGKILYTSTPDAIVSLLFFLACSSVTKMMVCHFCQVATLLVQFSDIQPALTVANKTCKNIM